MGDGLSPYQFSYTVADVDKIYSHTEQRAAPGQVNGRSQRESKVGKLDNYMLFGRKLIFKK